MTAASKHKINGRRVTYAELRENRKRKQAEHLARIVAVRGPVRHAAHVWTFYVPGMIYGGWHLYIRTHEDRWWLRKPEAIALEIMRLYPCGLFPTADNFLPLESGVRPCFHPRRCAGPLQQSNPVYLRHNTFLTI